jgi:tetratricopeptide (TPR) repeat protein
MTFAFENKICRALLALATALLLVLTAVMAEAGGWEMYAAGDQANRQGQYEQALVLFTDAIESEHLEDRELASAYFGRAFAYRSIGEYDQALADYNQALKAQPTLAEDELFYSGRILACLGTGDLTLAESDLNKALALSPDSASLINTRGLVLQKKGLYGQALHDHVKAMELSPQMWRAKADLAWLLATCPDERYRDGKQAVAFAEASANIKPDHFTLDVLAAAYAEAGRFDEAVKIMQIAIDTLEKQGRSRLSADLRPHLEAYQKHTPWRQ